MFRIKLSLLDRWTNRIGKKLAYGFGLLLAIFAISSIIILSSVREAQQLKHDLTIYNNQLSIVSQMTNITREKFILGTDLLIAGDERVIKQFEERSSHFNALLTEMQTFELAAEEKDILEIVIDSVNAFDKTFLVNIVGYWQLVEANAKSTLNLYEVLNDVQSQLVKFNDELAYIINQKSLIAEQQLAQALIITQLTVIISFVAALIIGLIISIVLTRHISKPLNETVALANRVSKGDLTLTNQIVIGRDELAILKQSFFEMTSKLRNNVFEIKEVNYQLGKVQDEVQASMAMVADNGKRLASVIEEMACSNTEQSSTVEQAANLAKDTSIIAENMKSECNKAHDKSFIAAENVKLGSNKFFKWIENLFSISNEQKKVADRVLQLQKAASEINKIVSSISRITEQTNLLSLNAAIEAARAGEHGRGFAVVAQEVKSLADESTQASKKIGEMIKGIQQITNDVANIVQGTSEKVVKLAEYGGEIKKIFADVLEYVHFTENTIKVILKESEAINNASHESSGAITQSLANIQQMAAGAEEISATVQVQQTRIEKTLQLIEELGDMRRKLENNISNFRV